MLMLTSRNINGGHQVGFTKSSYINRCSSMPLLPAGASMAVQSVGAEGNHQQNKT